MPMMRPSRPPYSRSGSLRTETMVFTGRKRLASTARKLGSAMKEISAAGLYSRISRRRALIRLRFRRRRDWGICACSMDRRSTPSGTGYSHWSTKLVTTTAR